MEETHNATLENVRGGWLHLLRLTNTHKENLVELFENHNFMAAARELQWVPTVNVDELEQSSDFAEKITKMASNAEQFFVTMEAKVGSGLQKKMKEDEETKVAHESVVNELQTKVEKGEKAVQQKAILAKKCKEAAEQVGFLESQLVNTKREHEAQQKMLMEKHQTLVVQHKNTQKEMIAIKGSYQESLKNMEDMLQTAAYHRRMMATLIREQEETIGTVAEKAQKKTKQKEKVLKLKLRDFDQNLATLERALQDKKIGANIYQMTVELILKRQELLEVKLANLMRRYMVICRLRKAKFELKQELESHPHLISSSWKAGIKVTLKNYEGLMEMGGDYPSRLARDLERNQHKLMISSFKRLEEYASEKAILTEMGITEDMTYDSNVRSDVGCRNCPKRMARPKEVRNLPLPHALMGIGVYNKTGAEEEPVWKPAKAPPTMEEVKFTAPKILQMDIQENVRKAKSTLEKRICYQMPIVEGFDCREFHDVIPFSVRRTPSLQLPPINSKQPRLDELNFDDN